MYQLMMWLLNLLRRLPNCTQTFQIISINGIQARNIVHLETIDVENLAFRTETVPVISNTNIWWIFVYLKKIWHKFFISIEANTRTKNLHKGLNLHLVRGHCIKLLLIWKLYINKKCINKITFISPKMIEWCMSVYLLDLC